MSYFARAVLGVTVFCALVSIAPPGAQALPVGVSSPPHMRDVILARRECIAWKRRPDGSSKCVRWAECGRNVC